jgi:hypothetical protein
MLAGKNIHYEMSSRDRAIAAGGIGAMQLLAQRLSLAEAIDERLHLLRVHLPYAESDHVLKLAYNALAGGTCIEDLERLRNSEGYLDSLGARRSRGGRMLGRHPSARKVLAATRSGLTDQG